MTCRKPSISASPCICWLPLVCKGGAEIRDVGISTIWLPLVACLMLGIIIPIGGYLILRNIGKFSVYDAAAIARHYGSVSAVTFAVATQFLASLQVKPEGYMSAFLAVLEPTGGHSVGPPGLANRIAREWNIAPV
ncbi:MAG: sodium-dependent bicarbonate transport family permease [Nitrospiraceae bacterium]